MKNPRSTVTIQDLQAQMAKVQALAKANQGLGDDANFDRLIREARRADDIAVKLGRPAPFIELIEKLERMQDKVRYYHQTGFYAGA